MDVKGCFGNETASRSLIKAELERRPEMKNASAALRSKDLAIEIINSSHPSLWILTGNRSSGKTYHCEELVSHFKETDFSIGGIISPPVFRGNRKIAIGIKDISTQQSRLLACESNSEKCNLHIGNWWFNPNSIKWGNQIIQQAKSCKILIIDEIGPLELEFNAGLTEALKILDNKEFNQAIIVVRPELLENALDRWPNAVSIQIEGTLR